MQHVRVRPDEEAEIFVPRRGEDRASAYDDAAPLPVATRRRAGLLARLRNLRRAPFLFLSAYYVLLITAHVLLVTYVPSVRSALIEPGILPAMAEGRVMLGGPEPVEFPAITQPALEATVDRVFTTVLVILGALSLVVPVAWVYMFIKRLRYDPALVRSVVILPIVVAGITLVVKNSIALAFALAGIVAAVRFRNTLKDPRDAVYIFLVIGIGLSAGVQALDIALVMSLLFNFVILTLWKFNVGSIYGGRYGRTGILSVGSSELLVAQTPEQTRQIRKGLLDDAEDLKTDGILLVHSAEPEMARLTVQEALSEMARDWRLTNIIPRGEGLSTLEYLVRLKKKAEPAELVGALDDRWSSQVSAAEYIPFRQRKRDRGDAGQNGKAKAKG